MRVLVACEFTKALAKAAEATMRKPRHHAGDVAGKLDTIQRILDARRPLWPMRYSPGWREMVWKLEWEWLLAERQLDGIVMW